MNAQFQTKLQIDVALSHPYVPTSSYSEEALYSLLEIHPSFPGESNAGVPINLVILLDASGTMNHFQMNQEERDYWMGVGISRNELERSRADERDAYYWTGKTLTEMQQVTQTPMTVVVEALKNLLITLGPNDKVAVMAFADTFYTVFQPKDWSRDTETCIKRLNALAERRLPVELGTETHMAGAMRAAGDALLQMSQGVPGAVNRLVVISDGLVQDMRETFTAVSQIQTNGYNITTLGIGEEFDEEFLTKIADVSRGEYYYAADALALTYYIQEEIETLQTVHVTNLTLAVRGLKGAVVQEITLAQPAISHFEEVFTENEWTRSKIGDVSSKNPISVLMQIAPPALPEGPHPIAEAIFAWTEIDGRESSENSFVTVTYSSDPGRLSLVNRDVMDCVDRLAIYQFEREAQRASSQGDAETAKQRLGAASRELHKIGEQGLADDVDQQIASLNKGIPLDPARSKRIKATTRRLNKAHRDEPSK